MLSFKKEFLNVIWIVLGLFWKEINSFLGTRNSLFFVLSLFLLLILILIKIKLNSYYNKLQKVSYFSINLSNVIIFIFLIAMLFGNSYLLRYSVYFNYMIYGFIILIMISILLFSYSLLYLIFFVKVKHSKNLTIPDSGVDFFIKLINNTPYQLTYEWEIEKPEIVKIKDFRSKGKASIKSKSEKIIELRCFATKLNKEDKIYLKVKTPIKTIDKEIGVTT